MVCYKRAKARHDNAVMSEHQIFYMLDYRYHYAKLVTSCHFSKRNATFLSRRRECRVHAGYNAGLIIEKLVKYLRALVRALLRWLLFESG